MNRRFLCECYRYGSGSQENASILLDCFDNCVTFVHGKSAKIKVSEKKTSKWIEDVHILHKRHWKVLVLVVKYSGLKTFYIYVKH